MLPAPAQVDFENDPSWYKDAIIYEVHVRAFYDSNGDGIGDFRGLTEKLRYLEKLGITAIWLLPFYPSPLRDDGYDIADYTKIHPHYGTMRDFRAFLREATRRGIRVITELVVNHTSDHHPWFQRARRARPGSHYRNYYVWSQTGEEYGESRIIFEDFETSNWSWDPVAQAYYWHRFYSHQPDLNYDNPRVRAEILRMLDYWLEMGVSGLRLDAVPYLYEREGTNCENLPETHQFLKKMRHHVEEHFKGRMLLSEANQWPEDAVAYFGEGDESHMAFHFPLMPRLFMAVRMEDYTPVVNILEQTPSIPEGAQWAVFLRNHDELTLEMVTDEERDYMYRMYAHDEQMRVNVGIRRRLAPLLSNDRRKIELLNALLFSLPGTPVLYYGDEIGMGDNFFLGDRNGVRTPMQWNNDRNAGFSQANPQRLYSPLIADPEYNYDAVNVEVQEGNPDSLLWWMRRIIGLRKSHKCFGRGVIEPLRPTNYKVLAFLRRYENETVLVVANLSRFSQHVSLDLSEFRGVLPVELFGGEEFPRITELPYPISLGRYGFYWFDLGSAEPEGATPATATFAARRSWQDLFRIDVPRDFPAVLRRDFPSRRWFGGKGRRMAEVSVEHVVPVPTDGSVAHVVFARVEYREGEPETYVVPLAFATGEAADVVRRDHPAAVVCDARLGAGSNVSEGVVYDALVNPAFGASILRAMTARRRFGHPGNSIFSSTTRAFRRIQRSVDTTVPPAVLDAEQSNTSIRFGNAAILKFFRKFTPGVNPDFEIGRFLTERVRFPNVPPVAAALEYGNGNGNAEEPATLAILSGYVENAGDAWSYSLDAAGRYFEQVLVLPSWDPPARPAAALVDLCGETPPESLASLIGPYLVSARLLGQRTAELHRALASRRDDEAFAPEPFTRLYTRSLYQGIRNTLSPALRLIRNRIDTLPAQAQADAMTIADGESTILQRLAAVTGRRLPALRIRTHGDYHLGQVLYTGSDFIIIDFEGEPARPLGERRIKKSPLRDVAGMLRSFDYASHAALLAKIGTWIGPESLPALEPWASLWSTWVSVAFLEEYLGAVEGTGLVPTDPRDLKALLDLYLIEKAVYEIAYEVNNRPDWARIPLGGLADLLRQE